MHPLRNLRVLAQDLRRQWFAVALATLIPFSGFMGNGCANEKVPMVPPELLGSWWAAATGDQIEFALGGIVVVTLKDGTTMIGRCSIEAQTITIRYQLGSLVCPEEPGRYTLLIERDSLAFKDPADTCAIRIHLLAQEWRREQGR